MEKRTKRLTRDERFIPAAAAEIVNFSKKIEGLTPEQRKDRDQLVLEREQARRNDIWTQWLYVQNWTIRQAAFLFAGYDPHRKLLGSSRHGGADRRHIIKLTTRLKALAQKHLEPVSRSASTELRRYRARELARLGQENGLGYAGDIEALAISRGIGTIGIPAKKKPRQPRSLTAERILLTIQLAKLLVAEGKGEQRADGIHLQLGTEQFQKLAKQRLSDARPIFAASPKTLERARKDRSSCQSLPVVHFKAGKPTED